MECYLSANDSLSIGNLTLCYASNAIYYVKEYQYILCIDSVTDSLMRGESLDYAKVYPNDNTYTNLAMRLMRIDSTKSVNAL